MQNVIITLLGVGAALVAIGAVATVIAMCRAPIGSETEDGFQFATRPLDSEASAHQRAVTFDHDLGHAA